MYRLEIEFDCTSSRICLTECLSSQPSYVLLPGLAVWRWITSCFGNICVLNTSKDIARIGVWTLLLPWHHWDWNNGNWSKYLFPILLINLLQVSSKITIMVNIYIICYCHAPCILLLWYVLLEVYYLTWQQCPLWSELHLEPSGASCASRRKRRCQL